MGCPRGRAGARGARRVSYGASAPEAAERTQHALPIHRGEVPGGRGCVGYRLRVSGVRRLWLRKATLRQSRSQIFNHARREERSGDRRRRAAWLLLLLRAESNSATCLLHTTRVLSAWTGALESCCSIGTTQPPAPTNPKAHVTRASRQTRSIAMTRVNRPCSARH
eukprot:356539-Chlamydomonas_euryale.AAC.3